VIGIVPDINKKFILGKLSQEEIFERYLGVAVVYGSEKFTSPLRDDTTPTCTFKRFQDGAIWFKDWSGHFQGDCFNVVQHVYNCNFYEACKVIAYDFNLVKGLTIGKDFQRKPKDYVTKEEAEIARIEVQWQELTSSDVRYWSDFGIELCTLNAYNTGAVKHAWVNSTLRYSRTDGDPCYGYYFGPALYKLYFPLRETYRFLGNYKGLQGYEQLPDGGTILVITKSLKDVMFMYQCDIPAVAPPSESSILTDEQYADLSDRFFRIVCIYDYDETGRRSAAEMKEKYDIEALFFTDGEDGTTDYGGKDLTDIAKNRGKLTAEHIIKHLLI
tara:strand:+ start:38 stop:1024 length:987 start_codon:yes stop_codon:yes gene_type:complete